MEQTLEIIGTLVGLLYLWLEYKASIYLWIAGIIMPAASTSSSTTTQVYMPTSASTSTILALPYGWMMWKYGAFLRRTILKKTAANIENPQQQPPITRMPLHYLLPLTAVFAATFAGIAWILINFTDSNVPLLDSFTTALSIIGMWMLARKYVEQWWAWIGVDAVSAGLYVYKGLDFTAALYALYTIIAIFGYFKWKKMMKG